MKRPKIITRKERGANEKLTHKVLVSPGDDSVGGEPTSKIEDFLQKNYGEKIQKVQNKKKIKEAGNELEWPIEYSADIRGITIHHTAEPYPKNDKESLDWILNFHAKKRGRGDIGYHFIVGLDGNIYQGRKGGETAIGAHVKYNNTQNVGIAVIGDYNKRKVSKKQKESLGILIEYLVNKYDIDTAKKQPFFKKCTKRGCKNPVLVEYHYPVMGHKDLSSATKCPGVNLYREVQKITKKIQDNQRKNQN